MKLTKYQNRFKILELVQQNLFIADGTLADLLIEWTKASFTETGGELPGKYAGIIELEGDELVVTLMEMEVV